MSGSFGPRMRNLPPFDFSGPSPRHSGSAEADPQASQEARISAEVAGHRQAALLRVGVPAIRAELPSRTGDQAQQSSRELSSAGATARAQGAAIQVASLRAALPEYACRRLQYLQSSTPSRLPIHAAKIPNRCCRAMEKRCHSRMMLGQFWLSMRTSFVAVTKPPALN